MPSDPSVRARELAVESTLEITIPLRIEAYLWSRLKKTHYCWHKYHSHCNCKVNFDELTDHVLESSKVFLLCRDTP